MNYTSIRMNETLSKLEGTLREPTPEQQVILQDLKSQIEEQGRYYEVCSISLEQMREHGYDVSEENCMQVENVAEKVEVDADDLWDGIAKWAKAYGIKELADF